MDTEQMELNADNNGNFLNIFVSCNLLIIERKNYFVFLTTAKSLLKICFNAYLRLGKVK